MLKEPKRIIAEEPFRADHRRAYCGAGSPAGVHTLGAGLYRFPAVARAVLSAGGGKEAGLIWHS